ncbi:MAG: Mur ligase domain-containing protein [Puniceicoccales bacterium]|jgi:UDP-N-acetylmuramoyl-tripeptide--D-alanyl-D-alanine ligase|nr:Mur ligase domain-containing protein [Puniceicoccales bacterium]
MINFANWTSSGAGYWLNGKMPNIVEKICNDARILSKNSCFIAIKTEKADGHDYALQAEQNGASCTIVDHEIHGITIPQFICKGTTIAGLNKIASFTRENFHGKVVGITGSMGKTSTKNILSLILRVQNSKTFSNENGQLGIPFTLAKFTNGEPIGIVEIGIDTMGTIGNLLEIAHPTDCIITGISRVHLNGFGDEHTIASEKIKLAEFVLNNSCNCVLDKELLRFECFKKIAQFCTIPDENVKAKAHFFIEYTEHIRHLNLRIEGQRYRFAIPYLMSNGTIKNLILAATFALLNGETPANISMRLQNWEPSALRGSLLTIGDCTFFADCYNANPAAFLDSLQNFDRLFPEKNRLFVIGSLDDFELKQYSGEENIQLGKNIPIRNGDTVILIGERAGDVYVGLLQASASLAKNVHCLQTTEEARVFIQAHHGAIYMKGHHFYRMDKLID